MTDYFCCPKCDELTEYEPEDPLGWGEGEQQGVCGSCGAKVLFEIEAVPQIVNERLGEQHD